MAEWQLQTKSDPSSTLTTALYAGFVYSLY